MKVGRVAKALADLEFVVRMAAAEMQKSFRRVTLDPARGLTLLLSPTRAHERVSELAGPSLPT